MKLLYSNIKILIIFILNNYYNVVGQRIAPGVNPQQYQQQQQAYQQHPQQPYQQQQPEYQQYQQQPQYGERAPPGVPATHYQQDQYVPQQHQQAQYQPQHQQQHQQQQQQQQYQHQQPEVHQQPQVNQQSQHHQQQVGGHGHGHHHNTDQTQQVLNAANVQQEREHIAEHMDVPIDTSNMSEQELQFHYFKMHDSDQNNMLDGCELIKSLIHWHEQGSKEPQQPGKPPIAAKIFTDEELTSLIDPILQQDDTSRDGFIDYYEFIKAQEKANQKKN